MVRLLCFLCVLRLAALAGLDDGRGIGVGRAVNFDRMISERARASAPYKAVLGKLFYLLCLCACGAFCMPAPSSPAKRFRRACIHNLIYPPRETLSMTLLGQRSVDRVERVGRKNLLCFSLLRLKRPPRIKSKQFVPSTRGCSSEGLKPLYDCKNDPTRFLGGVKEGTERLVTYTRYTAQVRSVYLHTR